VDLFDALGHERHERDVVHEVCDEARAANASLPIVMRPASATIHVATSRARTASRARRVLVARADARIAYARGEQEEQKLVDEERRALSLSILGTSIE
jgi:hypothetical protein